MLLGRDIRDFEHIDRVDESPEGYVIIEDDKGNEIKLPEKGDLTKVIDLTQSQCRNIFIVRNSDLSIAQESKFYTNITDRLIGLRTEEISKIKEKLREIGKLTESGIFKDTQPEKLKTRIDNARKLIEEIEKLSEEIKKEKLDELEKESVQLKDKIRSIKQEIKNLEDARRRENYEKGRKALEILKDDLNKIKDLEIYNENDEQLWRDCERDIKNHEERKEELLAQLKDKENELKEINEKLSEVETDFNILKEKKKDNK